MPSLIGVAGADGLLSSGAAANYLKAQPSTQFGTRQLSVLTISKEGLISGGTQYLESDSLYSKIIRALQQTAEIWAVFTPVENSTDPDSFNVIISADSQWTGAGAPAANTPGGKISDDSYDALAAALNTGAGTTGITVAPTAGFVAPFHG